MSFDIFLQAFEQGEPAERDGDVVRGLLLNHAAVEPDDGFLRIAVDGDGADVYGVPGAGESFTGLMFNHVGTAAFDVVFQVARAADLVIMAVGVPVCVVAADQQRHLPAELADEGVVVIGGATELREVVKRS